MRTDQIKINGTVLTYGDGWEVVAPGDFTARQSATINNLGLKAKLHNARSHYISGPVYRADGTADVYSVGPRGEIECVLTVDPLGGKRRMSATS